MARRTVLAVRGNSLLIAALQYWRSHEGTWIKFKIHIIIASVLQSSDDAASTALSLLCNSIKCGVIIGQFCATYSVPNSEPCCTYCFDHFQEVKLKSSNDGRMVREFFVINQVKSLGWIAQNELLTRNWFDFLSISTNSDDNFSNTFLSRKK